MKMIDKSVTSVLNMFARSYAYIFYIHLFVFVLSSVLYSYFVSMFYLFISDRGDEKIDEMIKATRSEGEMHFSLYQKTWIKNAFYFINKMTKWHKFYPNQVHCQTLSRFI
jgi:hypothetical protein